MLAGHRLDGATPSAIATCASSGGPAQSPIAQMPGLVVLVVVVDLDEAAVERDAHALEADALDVGAHADRHQHALRGDRLVLAVGVGERWW